jgi:hypothetical protein
MLGAALDRFLALSVVEARQLVPFGLLIIVVAAF